MTSLAYNQTQAADRMRTLPAGLLDALTGLTTLRLEQNDLETLPANLFEPLTNLTTLTLDGNPGSARFVPDAVAGPQGGIDAKVDKQVTLGGDRDADPWGSNVTYAWRKVEGPDAELSATNVARPTLTPPKRGRAENLIYEVEVTGRGARQSARDRVTIRLAVVPSVVLHRIISSPADGGAHYHAGETIEFEVEFTLPVLIEGTPQLAIEIGTARKHASYARGSGTLRPVFAYTVQAMRERGVSGALSWQQSPSSNRGATLTLTQTVGASSSGGADALLSRTTLDGLTTYDAQAEADYDDLKARRTDLTLGYGLSAFGDRFTFTPHAGVGLSDTGRDMRIGWRLTRRASENVSESMDVSFEARRREGANDATAPEHELGLQLHLRF